MMNQKFATAIQQKTIRKVFNQRSDFIIIGLTGSIESGLSDVTEILSSDYCELERFVSRFQDDDNIQKLERENVLRYARHNWKQFDVIKARDVIITYILENKRTYERFKEEIEDDLFFKTEFLNKCMSNFKELKEKNEYVDVESVKKELKIFIDRSLKQGLYRALFDKNKELIDYINVLRNKRGEQYNTRTTLSLYTYTKYILPTIGRALRDSLDREKYTTLFQRYGNEIRFFGTLDMRQWKDRIENIDNISNFDYFYSIAKRINTFIKIRRAPATNRKSVPVQIVIDSLKNPYEFSFLKDRYSAYYTFALLDEKRKETIGVNEFTPQHYNVLYENPNHIKKDFNRFISLLIEQARREVTLFEIQAYKYIEALETPDKFMEYLVKRLDEMERSDTYSLEWCPEIRMIDYSWEYERFGILEDEYKFFFSILKDPIRTFCMISGLFSFYLQDIQSSTQNADIFLGSITDSKGKKEQVYQIIKYVSLIMHPGLVPPTKIERCMQIAFNAKVNSGCISRQVGAVVTDSNYNILSTGWNDVPQYRVPCIYRKMPDLQSNPDEDVYSDLEREDSLIQRYVKGYNFSDQRKINNICEGITPSYCFKSLYGKITHEKEQKDSRAMHGEERAFHSCGNKGLAEGGCLFTTSSSCERCTIIANEYNIKKIYYIETYPGIAQSHVNSSGPKEGRAEFILYKGAIGVAYTKLYSPILPIKDELELRGIESLYEDMYEDNEE